MPGRTAAANAPGSVPSYPAVESAVRALAHVVEYAMWLRTPHSGPVEAEDIDTLAATLTAVLKKN